MNEKEDFFEEKQEKLRTILERIEKDFLKMFLKSESSFLIKTIPKISKINKGQAILNFDNLVKRLFLKKVITEREKNSLLIL